MNEHEGREVPAENVAEANKGAERIENGIWRPGILDEYSDKVAAAASTKSLRRTDEVALRILGDQQRFEKPMRDRIRAGRILAQLRDVIDSEVDLHNIVKTQLVHGGEIKKIDEEFVSDLVKGNLDKKMIAKTDGMVTNLKGYPLYVSAADCHPVGIYDPDHEAIGTFHNGIYGLLDRISEKGLAMMTKEYGTDPSKVKVVIAPGISEEYKISKKLFEEAQAKHPDLELAKFAVATDDPEVVKFDLGHAIKSRLMTQGVLEENIELSEFHTDKNNDLFPSERTEGTKRDTFGFMMVIK